MSAARLLITFHDYSSGMTAEFYVDCDKVDDVIQNNWIELVPALTSGSHERQEIRIERLGRHHVG